MIEQERVKEALEMMSGNASYLEKRGVMNGVKLMLGQFIKDENELWKTLLLALPDDFDLQAIPIKGLFLQIEPLAVIKAQVNGSFVDFSTLKNSANVTTERGRDQLLMLYLRVIQLVTQTCQHNADKEVTVQLSEFLGNGDQRQAYFAVQDTDLPKKEYYNFHGNNVSQVLFNGAIVADMVNERFSIHT